jgi:hypothetical protein
MSGDACHFKPDDIASPRADPVARKPYLFDTPDHLQE